MTREKTEKTGSEWNWSKTGSEWNLHRRSERAAKKRQQRRGACRLKEFSSREFPSLHGPVPPP